MAEYDPAKRRQRYLEERQLKGRRKGRGVDLARERGGTGQQEAKARVAELSAKVERLRGLLRQKLAAARSKNKADDPKTAGEKLKDRQKSKEYYDKNKQSIKNLRKGGGGGKKSESKSGGKSYDDMDVDELKSAIRNAVAQLKDAIAEARTTRGGG